MGSQVDVRHVPATADVHAGPGRELEQGGVEPRPVEADGRPAAALRAVGQPKRRPATRLDPHRGDRPRDGGECRRVQAGPLEGRDRGG